MALDVLPRRSWWQRALSTPLLTKLVVLDVTINVFAFLVMQNTPPQFAEGVTLLSLLMVLVLNAALVAWALKPLQVLEETARRVSSGEFGARTVMPPFTDRNLVRIGDTLNDLLDRSVEERERVRALAVQVIAVGDQERARVARELHDGTAQSLSALDMLLASALSEHAATAVSRQLEVMRDIVTESLSEVRTLCHTVHPRVLEDLGLKPALESLALRTREQSGLQVSVECVAGEVPMPVASVLYRVTQEAVHNAVKHARASSIHIDLRTRAGEVELSIEDDGSGFDRSEIERSRRGMGLFVMEERVALVGGQLWVASSPGCGTVVRAVVQVRGEG